MLSFRNIVLSWCIRNLFFKKTHSKTFHLFKSPVLFPREGGRCFNNFGECLQKRSFSTTFIYLVSYLSISPVVINLKSVARERLEAISASENGKTRLPHHRIEEFISQRSGEGGYLDDWKAKIEKLDRVDGLEGLARMDPGLIRWQWSQIGSL